jgi:hypothetical protein
MQAVIETTGGLFPAHTYLLDGDRLVAYIKVGTDKPYYFKQPIKGFDRRGRKFETADMAPFNSWAELLKAHVALAEPVASIKRVQGSKPNTWYEVNTDEHTCTCPGFTFRGACKHVKELEVV